MAGAACAVALDEGRGAEVLEAGSGRGERLSAALSAGRRVLWGGGQTASVRLGGNTTNQPQLHDTLIPRMVSIVHIVIINCHEIDGTLSKLYCRELPNIVTVHPINL